MNKPLKDIQQELTSLFANKKFLNEQANLDDIKPSTRINKDRVCQVYQNDYQERLISALANTYETAYEIIGEQPFREFAQKYMKQFPSSGYNLNTYGKDFYKVLPLDTLARELLMAEELFNEVFHLENLCENKIDLANLQIEKPLEQHGFVLNSQYKILQSSFAIYDCWDQKSLNIDATSPQNLLFFKNNFGMRYCLVSPIWLALLKALASNYTLEQAIENTADEFEVNEDDISGFFNFLVSEEFLLGIQR